MVKATIPEILSSSNYQLRRMGSLYQVAIASVSLATINEDGQTYKIDSRINRIHEKNTATTGERNLVVASINLEQMLQSHGFTR